MLGKLLSLAPPTFDRYIEPFCGSACLYLALRPSKAVLADLNPHVIATYTALRENPSSVAAALNNWQPTREGFLLARESDVPMSNIDAAARFLFLNRFSFNGVYRENRLGKYNVPFGGRRAGRLPSDVELAAFGDSLSGAALYCSDFEDIVALAGEDDFLYLDPPYHYGDTRNRGEYGVGAFTSADLDRLIEALIEASDRGVKVLLSYNRAHQLRGRLAGWKLTYTTVRRSVAGFSSSRILVREYQLRNY